MQFDLETACANAREQIVIPDLPLAAIRGRSARTATSRRGGRGTVAAIVAAFAMVAIAAAAVVSATHVTLKPGSVVVTSQDAVLKEHPTATDLEAFARGADFRVIFPSGLPQGTKLRMMASGDHSTIMLWYDMPGAWRRDNHALHVLLANPNVVGGRGGGKGRYSLEFGHGPHYTTQTWRVGGEQVIVQANVGAVTTQELSAMKTAMLKEAAR